MVMTKDSVSVVLWMAQYILKDIGISLHLLTLSGVDSLKQIKNYSFI